MIGNCPECGEDYLNAKTIEDGKTYCWTRARCQCGHVFMFRVDPPGIICSAQRTLWECKACDDTTCHLSTDGDIRNIKPFGCPLGMYSQSVWVRVRE